MMKRDTFYSFTYQLNTRFSEGEKLTLHLSLTHFAHAVTFPLKLIPHKKPRDLCPDINFKPKKLWSN